MSRRSPLFGALSILALLAQSGCKPQQPFYLYEDGDLSHYIGMATDLEVPDLEDDTLPEVMGSIRPFSLENDQPREIWDLTLEQAVQCALANNKVMRSIGATVAFTPGTFTRTQFLSAPSGLTEAGDASATVYDPAIAESNPRFGPEAALSAFDAQLSSSVFWEKNDRPQNIAGFFEDFRPTIFEQDLGLFQAEIRKTNATGGTATIRHNVNYELNNVPVFDGLSGSRAYGSDWNVNLEAEFRQPLMQGAGVQFNRIAGPASIPGFNNGVVIARINTDIALADFEASVQSLVMDVEKTYWGLYVAYRELDAVVAGRDSALQTWRRIYALYQVGARGGEAEKEAQAREQFFLFRGAVEQALSDLYSVESNLRYLMGLAPTDGRLIRPADKPTTAKVIFDWHETMSEALVRGVELRRQRWRVKQRELELIAAKNYLLPRFDAIGRYRWLGLGDHLIDSHGGIGDPSAVDSNAYQVMTGGRFQEWQLGLELTFPIGFRKEMAGVRYAQLNLARDRARLQEMELERAHIMAQFIRDLESGYVLTQTNFNRRIAAKRQVDAVAAAYETETVTLDLLLEAQRRLAQAETDYYNALLGYNVAIAGVHFRKGSLLEYNGIHLAEGPWPGKAYFDAHGRARARDASCYLDYGFTRPKVLSRGVYNQQAGQGCLVGPPELFDGFVAPGVPVPADVGPELIPTPAPEPLELLPEPPEPQPMDDLHAAGQPAAEGGSTATNTKGSAVEPAGHHEPIAPPMARKANDAAANQHDEPHSRLQWGPPQRADATHEPDANPSPAETDPPAPGR